jgi:hypothetical protein
MPSHLIALCYNYNSYFPIATICSVQDQTQTAFSWLKDYQPLITIGISIIGWLLILYGWNLTNKHNNKRESRKELRSELDRIVSELEMLKEKTFQYYTTSARGSEKLAFEIKTSQQTLLAKIENLSKRHPEFSLNNCLVQFIDVVTGGDFESKTRKKRTYTNKRDTLLQEISLSTTNLITSLESDFCKAVGK